MTPIFTRLTKIIKTNLILIWFTGLFIVLLIIYFPSFFHPPRSDYWPAFYFFHQVSAPDVSGKWLHILNYDPWTHVRFQPMSHLIIYFEHLLFGSRFIYFHIVNFLLYFASLILLYKLSLKFCKSRLLSAIFIGAFSFLFSHSDIVSWPYHCYIIFSFCSFLLGYILYANYLKSGKKANLFFVIFSFLLGMLCYEALVLWPFAIIILDYMGMRPRRKAPPSLFVIGIVYVVYAAIFFLTKSIATYRDPLISLVNLFSVQNITLSFFAAFFNILYNGFLISIGPNMAYPLIIDENINMGGLAVQLTPVIEKGIFLAGGLFVAIFLAAVIILFKQKKSLVVKTIAFFLFLVSSELFILLFCRSATNTFVYSFTQFRYQYISNAFFVLIVIYLIGELLRPSRREKIIICAILLMISIPNIYSTRFCNSFLGANLRPLNILLSNIKRGIDTKHINEKDRLYLDDGIANKLSSLGWNRDMSQFMEGTYQWMFSRRDIKSFAFTIEDAKWVIDERDFSIKAK